MRCQAVHKKVDWWLNEQREGGGGGRRQPPGLEIDDPDSSPAGNGLMQNILLVAHSKRSHQLSNNTAIAKLAPESRTMSIDLKSTTSTLEDFGRTG